MTGTRLPLLGALAGVVVGTVVAAALVATGVLRVPTERDTSDAQADFLAAWSRSRTGTFVVESDFRRIVDGRTLYSPTELVQRPPDRLIRQFSGVSGTVDGHPIVCSTDQSANFSCHEGSEQAPSYDDASRTELDGVKALFTPPQPGAKSLYRVIRGVDDGCYELYRQLPVDDAPYGTYGKVCFDPATGAISEIERHLDRGVVERQHATQIRTDVISSDFDLSSDEGNGLTMDLPAPDLQGSGTTVPPDPGSTQATTTTTATAPAVTDEQLEAMDFGSLLTSSAQVPTDQQSRYATEATLRVINGKGSINDEHWLDASGQPIAIAPTVVRVLLGQGYVPFGPPS